MTEATPPLELSKIELSPPQTGQEFSQHPEQTRKDIQYILEQLEMSELGVTEKKNQREKFLDDIQGKSTPFVHIKLLKWKGFLSSTKEISQFAEGRTEVNKIAAGVAEEKKAISIEVETAAEGRTEVNKIAAGVAEKTTTVTEKTAKVKEDYQEINEFLKRSALLISRIKEISGGKGPADLIPNYSNLVDQTRKELSLQGKDPGLAENIVLVTHESDIFKGLESIGKTLTSEEQTNLRNDFQALRGRASELGLPAYTPTSLAMRDTGITLEVYTKIKAGFEPPSQSVWVNPRGEYISQSAPLTGERTIMTSTGQRFREKEGLRIESPVPDKNTEFSAVEELSTARKDLDYRNKLTSTITTIARGELIEKFPKTTFPNLHLPKLEAKNPEEASQELTNFFRSPGWTDIAKNPTMKEQVKFAEDQLKQYYQSIISKDTLTKNITSLEAKNPEEILKQQLRNQDETIDGNLAKLTRIGVQHLGQQTYSLLRENLNVRLLARAETQISDQSPITEHQSALIEKGMLALIDMDRETAYPDGKLSPEAMRKLQKLQTISSEQIAEIFKTENL